MGINRQGARRDKADETGRDPDELPANRGKEKGDESSRLGSSEEPSEDREKREVAEKPRKREEDQPEP